MKISKLHIDQFRHLENLDFDFTYPEDFHIEEKRGKPLDKICFIGQSATGKTGLLELINEQIMCALHISLLNGNTNSASVFSEYLPALNGEIELLFDDTTFNRKNEKFFYNDKAYIIERQSGYGTQLIPTKEEKIIYLKANLISDKNIDIFTKNPIDLIEIYRKGNEVNIENLLDKSFNRSNFVFNDNVDPKIWLFLLSEILEYRKNFTQRISELIHIKNGNADLSNLGSEIQKWQKENPNKVEIFAQKFNPLLEKLYLEVDIVNTEYPIPLKNKKTNEIIGLENTSTGTKGLLLSFLPIYKLEAKDSVILIDEPERSLYPDIQMDLMDQYKRLAPEAQFIVATHSPFIAASFEPEERFILYFDADGKVQVRPGKSPIGDDPNDMLFNDFGVNYYNDDVQEKFKEYLELLDKVKSESNKELKKKYLLEASKLGNQYNFILDEKNQERLQ